jgi:hypothetical protein
MVKRRWLGCLGVCLLLTATVVACVPALHWACSDCSGASIFTEEGLPPTWTSS